MASGHVNRIKRPNTWLHRPMLQNVKKALANPEPSTHDPSETFECGALDTTLHLDDHVRPAELGRHHGRRRLAAEPRPRTV